MIKNIAFLFLVFFSISSFAQVQSHKKVNYAHQSIDVPEKYTAISEYEVSSDQFAAQWLYLTQAMYENNVQSQIIQQFENQMDGKAIGTIKFLSGGNQFSGKLYKIKKADLKYRILAYGVVNNQPLVLNLSFKEEPKPDIVYDSFTRQFFQFNK